MSTPLNEEALEVAVTALDALNAYSLNVTLADAAEVSIRAYLAAVPADTVNSAAEAFINQRPGYITALKNTRGNDSLGDYWRWSGHAEARRQLAESLGWTVPHNPGETTRPEANDGR